MASCPQGLTARFRPLLKRCCNVGSVPEIPGQRSVSISSVVAMDCSIFVKLTHYSGTGINYVLCFLAGINRLISQTVPTTDL